MSSIIEMPIQSIRFSQPARSVYTAVKHVIQNTPGMKRVKCDDERFIVTASHGWSLIPLGENVKIRVVADGTQETDVYIESKGKIPLNPLVIGRNKVNVQELSDYIKNRVGRLCSDEEIKLRR